MKKLLLLVLQLTVLSMSACNSINEKSNSEMSDQSTSLKDEFSESDKMPEGKSVQSTTPAGENHDADLPDDGQSVKVQVETTAGNFTVLLYGDTPRHRDNFLKLAKSGYYDGVLFHRVIKDFMVQTGDPNSKNAPQGKQLGSGDPGYTIAAEFVCPKHFHKKGALAAARTGDQVNPERRSSGSQFYVVTGQVFTPAQLTQLEQQMQQSQKQTIFNRLVNENRSKIDALMAQKDEAALLALQDQLIEQTEQEAAANPAHLTDEQRNAYTTVGGTPHLDGEYTVFGEVIDGMDVIDAIQNAQTDGYDRPLTDIKVLSMKVL